MSYKIMQIETSNRCSLSCVYCPHPTQKRPKGDMDFETFSVCIELVKRSANPERRGRKFVHLNHFGEPLLNPLLPKFIAHAVSRGVEVSFATNAVDDDRELFPRQLWRELADAGLKLVHISTHAKSYKTIFEHIGDIVTIGSVWEPKKSKMHDWAGQVPIKGLQSCSTRAHSIPCDYEAHNMFAIAWNGKIAACCYDVEARAGLDVFDVLQYGFRFRKISICKTCCLGRGDASWIEDKLGAVLG